ncbi:MAG TPA: TadE family protein [Anaerovoracaceae bacterium]|nr:TadE family protein [Anaerovoracaceae bacterium]
MNREVGVRTSSGATGRKQRFPFNNRGAAMVEAAMIFPLVIAGIMAVIYIVISLYLSLSLQTSLHLALRRECGELSGTVYRLETEQDNQHMDRQVFQPERGWDGIRPVVRMEEEREYRIKTLFKDSIIRKEQGRSYVIDEAELERIFSSLREGS